MHPTFLIWREPLNNFAFRAIQKLIKNYFFSFLFVWNQNTRTSTTNVTTTSSTKHAGRVVLSFISKGKVRRARSADSIRNKIFLVFPSYFLKKRCAQPMNKKYYSFILLLLRRLPTTCWWWPVRTCVRLKQEHTHMSKHAIFILPLPSARNTNAWCVTFVCYKRQRRERFDMRKLSNCCCECWQRNNKLSKFFSLFYCSNNRTDTNRLPILGSPFEMTERRVYYHFFFAFH